MRKISDCGIVPVAKISEVEQAKPLAHALLEGGIGCIEVTFRTQAAAQAIQIISQNVPRMLVGAGTVTTVEQVDEAIEAGAKFLVSPGFNEKVVRHAMERGTPIVPGCTSPRDIERALELGLCNLKFFPAEQLGGLSMIRALCGPYPGARFMATGGVSEENAPAYLACDKVFAVGGSWMVKEELMREKKYDAITQMCRSAMRRVLGFHVEAVRLHGDGAQDEREDSLLELLGGSLGECECRLERVPKAQDGAGRGIVISTLSLERALAYFTLMGRQIDESRTERAEDGSLSAFYLKERFCGLEIQFVTA
ncbi:bifunctional 4-hydroxy-2-oxoglutarate aldolase/2-dehydro-3-deoxy-phosphogluconate aldolase [Clostridiales bacterium BX7]|uniref:2-dehydro-3-deoxy-phosphogluconate aldolase n=2 Tax=Feifania hominis TaxID=2763660 RepID=A0A926DAX4_9FIRM|nr:bifunctional 4-hydroxy-2-oxoglutarate aldolase/2-dehydro-3-deoxy-phosphogluconate aldolase [Feifania hominis]